MRIVFLSVFLILLVGGLFLWAHRALPAPAITPFKISGVELIASPAAVVEGGPAMLEGVVVYEAAADVEAPPYIQYSWGDGVRTKQLIFRNRRGCSPEAGDLPCFLPEDSVPRLAYGQRIRVSGTIVGDQILVDAIEGR